VVPHGELDLATAARLQATLDEQFANGVDHVVADLRELTFIDSTGVRTLWSVHQRADRDGMRLSLIVGDGNVQRALRVTGLLERMHLVER
jgi:anti-anti-sigma factor